MSYLGNVSLCILCDKDKHSLLETEQLVHHADKDLLKRAKENNTKRMRDHALDDLIKYYYTGCPRKIKTIEITNISTI